MAKKTGKESKVKKQEVPKQTFNIEIAAIITFSIGVFLGLSVFTSVVGSFGKFVGEQLHGLFGNASYLLPFITAGAAIRVLIKKDYYDNRAKYWLVAFVPVIVAALVHLIFHNEIAKTNFVLDLFLNGRDGVGGGLIGGVIAEPLIKFFGDVGAGLVLYTILLIDIIIITRISIGNMLKSILREVFKQMKSETKDEVEIPFNMEQKEIRAEKKAAAEFNKTFNNVIQVGEKPGEAQLKDAALPKKATSMVAEAVEFEKLFEAKTHELDGADIEPSIKLFNSSPSANKSVSDQGIKKLDGTEDKGASPSGGGGAFVANKAAYSVLGAQNAGGGVQTGGVQAVGMQTSGVQVGGAGAVSVMQLLAESSNSYNDDRADVNEVDIVEQDAPVEIEYCFPPVSLLTENPVTQVGEETIKELKSTAKKLIATLASFGVEAKVINISNGPSVTRYEISPNAGVKVSKVVNLSDDIALNLAASGVRIEAPIPGKAAIGIEIPNKTVSSIYLRDVVGTDEFEDFESRLAFALGKDITGRSVIADIAKMPHLLIAGATGSGKSVCINTLITSILYKANPNEVRLIMIDPKVVELGVYNGIPHLEIPVVTDARKAAGALNWAVSEMTRRYALFAENSVRDLKGYNNLATSRNQPIIPQMVIIIDELADLMMVAPREVEDSICRLAQMARAAGMHLVIATQRPSVDVITGIIKANIPSRISFAVSSQIDSRTILDMAGAEKLLGRGDMLFYPVGAAKPVRLQGPFVSDKEIETIVDFVKTNSSPAQYNENVIEHINKNAEKSGPEKEKNDDYDDMLPQAIEVVVERGEASASMLQRKLRLGYARASRLIDQMEERGLISPSEGSKPRQVLITRQQMYEMNINA